jgi:hypothetical protein
MAIVMIMEWPGFTAAKYDDILRITNIAGDPPAGNTFHVAAMDGDTLRVVDVWQSPEQFEAFTQSRLMAAVQQAGITSQPNIKVLPAHNILTPGYNAK